MMYPFMTPEDGTEVAHAAKKEEGSFRNEGERMPEPVVSVIVPAYNVEKYIRKCLLSILSSTVDNIEVIVVDDKSEDNTLAQIQSISDPRISVIAKETRGGVSMARNDGIDHSRGEFISFVDADDWVAPAMLEKLLLAQRSYDADLTFCNHYVVNPDGEKNACDLNRDLVFRGDDVNQYIQMFVLKGKEEFKPYFPMGQPWGTLFRTKLIKDNKISFVEGMQYKEDVIFSLYAAQNATTIVRINEPLYYYNKCNTGSLTTSDFKKGMLPRIEKDIQERILFYREYRKEDTLFREGLYQHICRSFLHNAIPSCINEDKYGECKDLLKTDEYQEAIHNVQKCYLTPTERISISLLQHHGFPVYYSSAWFVSKAKRMKRAHGSGCPAVV